MNLVWLLALAAQPGAVEAWTDARLPVTSGLVAWWDASRQNAAREARGLPALSAGASVDRLLDGSGNRRDLVAADAKNGPALRQIGDVRVLHFDGAKHALEGDLQTAWRADSTVCLVAAPQSDRGGHRSLLALASFSLTLGAAPSQRFDALTIGGGANLIKDGFELGTYHTLCADGGRLFVDGQAHGHGPAQARSIGNGGKERWSLGARGGERHFDGDIAEVLVYARALSDAERRRVERYLIEKHAALSKTAPGDVQVLVPGFTVRPLPVSLPNINNVRYRPDGTLVAVGYDGKIYLLDDSNGDGLEDRVRVFWDDLQARGSLGAELTPPGYPRGQGVFVAANRKLSLVLDRDADDRADEETVVAASSTDSRGNVETRPVGAIGVAIDAAGNIYFGQGAANFASAYLVDKATGRSLYDLKDERGVVLKVSPDFKKKEIVSTGVRYPVGMAFNRAGDLFATDQEGATWLPNGNPFDELLHIQKGRHYGFPPRHPQHLANVIDEPSVLDYAPQHQSTCGFVFDETSRRRPAFGPAWWEGDAFVTGFSRGKLFRTKLVKTKAGYVAQNQIFASLGMLPSDVTLSPKGDLLVTAHGGRPDWGSGPHGVGRLFKISYTGRNEPQPALVYAASPTETRVVFDRPLTTEIKRARLTSGAFVTAGDRFEVWRPGYAVVKMQERAPRREIGVSALALSDDKRTLIIKHGARADAGSRQALTLFGAREIDVDHDLGGVEAIFHAKDSRAGRRSQPGPPASPPDWSGWLPSLDLEAALALTAPSGAHAELARGLRRPGTLTLRARLDLSRMLRPAVQPGSKLDYELPDEDVTVTVSGSGAVTLRADGSLAVARHGPNRASLTVRAPDVAFASRPTGPAGRPGLIRVEITLATGRSQPRLAVEWHTKEDPRPRAFPLRRIVLPWAAHAETVVAAADLPELHGGSWTRGKTLFFGDGACSRCHRVNGEGAKVGPDLSNLIYRDYDSVLRDIREPNAALNPDHLAQIVTLAGGEMLTGIVQENRAADVVLIDASGAPTTVARNKIASIKASEVSLMPEGLDQALGPERLRDLMTFLLTPPTTAAAAAQPR